MDVIRIGTRASKLAVAQAELVYNSLKVLYPDKSFAIKGINSQGDRKRDQTPSAPRDKKDWIVDIEEALVRGEIEIAVHSAKDVPDNYCRETELYPVLKRAKPNDVFIANKLLVAADSVNLETFPPKFSIGTSSLRRQAQLKRFRSDLRFLSLRGNISTRIRKVQEERKYGGIIISYASIERLGLLKTEFQVLPIEKFCPAVNQGILMAQCRKGDSETKVLLEGIKDEETNYCCWAERAFIARIGADCHSAVAVYCERAQDKFQLTAEVYSVSENKILKSKNVSDQGENPVALGNRLADELIAHGAKEFLGKN